MALGTAHRHLSGLPSRPAPSGFGLGLGWTCGSIHNGEQRLKPAAQSQLCSPNPEQHGVRENRRGLGRKRHKRWWGEGRRRGTRKGQAQELLQALGLQPDLLAGRNQSRGNSDTHTPTHTHSTPHRLTQATRELGAPRSSRNCLPPICVRAWRPIIDHRLQGWGAGAGARVSRCPWQPLPKLREGSCLYLCVSVPDLM